MPEQIQTAAAWVTATYRMMAAENMTGAVAFLLVVAAVCLGPLALALHLAYRAVTGAATEKEPSPEAAEPPLETLYLWLETSQWRVISALTAGGSFMWANRTATSGGDQELAMAGAGLGVFCLFCALRPDLIATYLRWQERRARERRRRRRGGTQITENKDGGSAQ